ncbi:MAG: ribosome maturation factor RimM [Gammaproteobacteria bacterium]|nr:ribosome maturation factor RimM [Gammaproteobacteria bacterium]
MSATPQLVVIGRIGGAYGVSGMVRVSSATQPRDNIEHYRPWYVGTGRDCRALEVVELRVHGQGYVARLAGVTDRDQAQALAGQEIAVPRSALPALDDDGEYYWQDLMGLAVSDTAGRELGRVERLLETPAHDVLVIRDGDRETLIPFAAPFVVDVDLAGQTLRVSWQE